MSDTYYYFDGTDLVVKRSNKHYKRKLDLLLKKLPQRGVRELSKKVSWYTQVVCPYCGKPASSETSWAIKRYKMSTYRCKRCENIMNVSVIDAYTTSKNR
jgi:hypothetical protein